MVKEVVPIFALAGSKWKISPLVTTSSTGVARKRFAVALKSALTLVGVPTDEPVVEPYTLTIATDPDQATVGAEVDEAPTIKLVVGVAFTLVTVDEQTGTH